MIRLHYTFWLGLVTLFVGRLLFGLTSEFFFEDETQIYLMGLRSYTTGSWPYFGPDVVWTQSEIPGALQPLLVGLPLAIAPFPEAPFVLLNLLSFAALGALAWYIGVRLPSLPRWLIWGWLMTLPWTLQYSTHIINPSYVLPAAIVFFVGFFEAVPSLTAGRLPSWAAFSMMGAGVTWIMQIHMSWPVLLPYAAFAWLSNRGGGIKSLGRFGAAFVAGAAIPALVLLPTILQFGLTAGSGGVARNLQLRWVRPDVILTTLARVFSFASLEINRFIATDGAKRLVFFREHVWLVPFAVIVGTAGLVQPFWMLASWFRRKPGCREWPALRLVVAGTVALIYASYSFVLEPPQAQAFYLVAPISLIFAAYCWSMVDGPRSRKIAAWLLAINVVYQTGFALGRAPERSLYKNRRVVAEAIRRKEPEMFGHRRSYAVEPGPTAIHDPSRPYDATIDIQLRDAVHTVGWGRTLDWEVTVTNTNPRVAFRDLLYITTYRDGEGRTVEERHEYIEDVFQPFETRRVQLNDRFADFVFSSATMRIAAAEALLPLPPAGSQ
jgi:hypothetical protein